MKRKTLLVFLCFFAALSLASTVTASSPAFKLSASKTTVHKGETVTITLSVSGADKLKSGSVEFSFPENFELVSAEWTVDAPIKDVNSENRQAVFSFMSETDINGKVFKIKLKAVAESDAADVTVTVKLKNGSTDIGEGSAKAAVAVREASASSAPAPQSSTPPETSSAPASSTEPTSSEPETPSSDDPSEPESSEAPVSSEFSSSDEPPQSDKTSLLYLIIAVLGVYSVTATVLLVLKKKK